MINRYGNLWNSIDEYDAVFITTNGTIKKNGSGVMGRGIAKQAMNRYDGIDQVLGTGLSIWGNNVFQIWRDPRVFNFPVKHEWRQGADLELIQRSAEQLAYLVTMNKWTVALNYPGIGNGGLYIKQVSPIVEELPDSVEVWQWKSD